MSLSGCFYLLVQVSGSQSTVPGAAALTSPENLLERLFSDPEPLEMGPKSLTGPPNKCDTRKVGKWFVTLK